MHSICCEPGWGGHSVCQTSATGCYVIDGRDTFFQRTLIQDAVLRNLQILAESAGRINPDLQTRYPEIPWQEVRGFRNLVVHDYLGIDLKFVWEIVTVDLPELKRQIEQVSSAIIGGSGGV